MIKKIKQIEDAGIFKYWRPEKMQDFRRYNLLYGWNGSGKTTLARIFRNLESPRKVAPNLSTLRYTVLFDDKEVSESSSSIPEKVMVFNSDFIHDNLSLDIAGANSILYVGDKTIELKRELNSLLNSIETHNNILLDVGAKLKVAENAYDGFFNEEVRRLSEFHATTVFSRVSQSIDRNYINQIWDTIKKAASLKDFVLSPIAYKAKRQAIQQGAEFRGLQPIALKFDQGYFDDAYNRLNRLLETSLVRDSIYRLEQHPNIQEWVRIGRTIHNSDHSLRCEYCQQEVPSSRIEELDKHFNNAYDDLQRRLTEFIHELKAVYVTLPEIDLRNVLPEHKQDFEVHLQEAVDTTHIINRRIDDWVKLLEEKQYRPHIVTFNTQNLVGSSLNSYISQLNAIITWQNETVDRKETITWQYKKEIERHLIASSAISNHLLTIEKDVSKLSADVVKVTDKIDELSNSARIIEHQISDDTVVLDKFNNDLHRFIGKDNIRLEPNTGGGYVILRDGKPALNLSEGEKSAICLIYFVKKLQEKENHLENTIVVFDDPVSSFDSNHLFQACSYILTNCMECKQMFILTHNFWFFKLARDWMNKQYDKKKGGVALFEVRTGNIQDAPLSLVNHHSEYHYMFTQVLRWSKAESIDWHDNFALANCCRRLLEAFNAFKFPHTKSFEGVLVRARSLMEDESEINVLFHFLHKYSHLDRIETHENTLENKQSESKAVVTTTLNVIKAIDEDHFESMKQLFTELEDERG